MFILGGMCFICLGLINKIILWNMPLWQQTAAGAGICAVVLAGRPDWTAPVFALAFAAAVIVFSVLMAAGELRENWGARG